MPQPASETPLKKPKGQQNAALSGLEWCSENHKIENDAPLESAIKSVYNTPPCAEASTLQAIRP